MDLEQAIFDVTRSPVFMLIPLLLQPENHLMTRSYKKEVISFL